MTEETKKEKEKKSPFRVLWLLLGLLCLGLGTVGVVLPILPTVPFYLATAFCFAKSSRKLHDWFLKTSLYKKHLESFVEDRSMTKGTKIKIIVTVTLLMGVGFAMMGRVPVGRILLVIVWVFHLWYFIFRIDTRQEINKNEE